MLGPHNDILHSGRPTQKNIKRRNNTGKNIEQDAFEITGFSAKIGQKHTLHYPIKRSPQIQHSPEQIIKELGLEQVFDYEQQPVGNSQSKSVGGKVESVPAVMDKLVSVLKINEKMLAPIHQTVPQHTAPNQTQIDQS